VSTITTTVDEKYRIVLGKRLRKATGIEKGQRLVMIPFHGGIVLVSSEGRAFADSLARFRYDEEKHEASRYLFKE
jgi:bifunctional DNA-binding transcriptional regulator/antitoxin component of YhaV-PrlF toxin-antitoxin module